MATLRVLNPDGISFPGQAKPNSIPRIDWTHPLTRGLAVYWFDTGMGFYIDLVSGMYSVVTPTVATLPPLAASAWGTGFFFGNTTSTQSVQATNPQAQTVWNAPYAFACGFSRVLPLATAGTSYFWNLANTNGNSVWQIRSNGTTISAQFGGSATASITLPAINTYATVVGSCNTTVGTMWLNGGVSNATVTGTMNVTVVNPIVLIDEDSPGDNGEPGIGAFVYWAAAWFGANLSQQDSMQLYLDPYCFLLPAEGDMPSTFLMPPVIPNPAGASIVTNAAGEQFQIGTGVTVYAGIPTVSFGAGTTNAFPPGAVEITSAQSPSITVNTFPTGTTDTTFAQPLADTGQPLAGSSAETTSAQGLSITANTFPPGSVGTGSAASLKDTSAFGTTGTSSTTSTGSFLPVIGAFPSGVAATVAAQIPAIVINVFIPGTFVTTSAGSPLFTNTALASPLGASQTTSAQALAVTIALIATGVGVTTSPGTVAKTIAFTILSVGGTASAGSTTDNTSFGFTGAADTATAGQAVPNVVPSISGATETTSASQLVETVNVFFSGASDTANASQIAFGNTVFAGPTGASETTSAGSPFETIAIKSTGGAATAALAALSVTIALFPAGAPVTSTAGSAASSLNAIDGGASDTSASASLSTVIAVSPAGASGTTSARSLIESVFAFPLPGIGVTTASPLGSRPVGALPAFVTAIAGIATVSFPAPNPVRKIRARLGFPGGVVSIGRSHAATVVTASPQDSAISRGRGSNTNVSISGPVKKGN